jgi:hypothetical protein
MRVAIPHALGKDEARRRIGSRIHELGDFLPGMATVQSRWTGEDQLRLDVGAMGQSITGTIEVAEAEVVFDIDLPAALGFIEPMISGAIRSQGTRLLGPPGA